MRGLATDPRRPCEEGDSTLGLGELAQLTVNNDAEVAYDVSQLTLQVRSLNKRWIKILKKIQGQCIVIVWLIFLMFLFLDFYWLYYNL